MEDKQLIKGCLQGDMDDFKKIINKYRGKAMALALNILRNREDAEDACQDAFVKIYHSLGKFDMSQSFSSWFYSIIYNQCLDYVRKKSRYYKLLNRIRREPLPVSNKEKTFSSEKLSLAKSVLKSLSPKERTVLFLWAEEGYTSEEISRVLKCSSSSARVHLYRARKKLKTILEKKNASMQNN